MHLSKYYEDHYSTVNRLKDLFSFGKQSKKGLDLSFKKNDLIYKSEN